MYNVKASVNDKSFSSANYSFKRKRMTGINEKLTSPMYHGRVNALFLGSFSETKIYKKHRMKIANFRKQVAENSTQIDDKEINKILYHIEV